MPGPGEMKEMTQAEILIHSEADEMLREVELDASEIVLNEYRDEKAAEYAAQAHSRRELVDADLARYLRRYGMNKKIVTPPPVEVPQQVEAPTLTGMQKKRARKEEKGTLRRGRGLVAPNVEPTLQTAPLHDAIEAYTQKRGQQLELLPEAMRESGLAAFMHTQNENWEETLKHRVARFEAGGAVRDDLVKDAFLEMSVYKPPLELLAQNGFVGNFPEAAMVNEKLSAIGRLRGAYPDVFAALPEEARLRLEAVEAFAPVWSTRLAALCAQNGLTVNGQPAEQTAAEAAVRSAEDSMQQFRRGRGVLLVRHKSIGEQIVERDLADETLRQESVARLERKDRPRIFTLGILSDARMQQALKEAREAIAGVPVALYNANQKSIQQLYQMMLQCGQAFARTEVDLDALAAMERRLGDASSPEVRRSIAEKRELAEKQQAFLLREVEILTQANSWFLGSMSVSREAQVVLESLGYKLPEDPLEIERKKDPAYYQAGQDDLKYEMFQRIVKEEGLEDKLIGNDLSRNYRLMQVGDEEKSRKFLLDLARWHTGSEEEKEQANEGLLAFFDELYQKVLDFDMSRLENAGEDELIAMQDELYGITCYDMRMSDLSRKMQMIDKTALTGKTDINRKMTMREYILGARQNEYIARVSMIHYHAELARGYAVLKALDKGSLTIDAFMAGELDDTTAGNYLAWNASPEEIREYVQKKWIDAAKVWIEKDTEAHRETWKEPGRSQKEAEWELQRRRRRVQEVYFGRDEKGQPAYGVDIIKRSRHAAFVNELGKNKKLEPDADPDLKEGLSEAEFKKLQSEHYCITGTGIKLGEAIFRSFVTLLRSPVMEEVSERDYKQMLKDLAAGAELDLLSAEEQAGRAEEVKQAGDLNRRGLKTLKEIMRQHFAYMEDKYGLALEDTDVVEVAEHHNELMHDIAYIQVSEGIFRVLPGVIDEEDPEDVLLMQRHEYYATMCKALGAFSVLFAQEGWTEAQLRETVSEIKNRHFIAAREGMQKKESLTRKAKWDPKQE